MIKLFESFTKEAEIMKWLKDYDLQYKRNLKAEAYEIDYNGAVSIEGSFLLKDVMVGRKVVISKLPVNFEWVSDDFICKEVSMTTLVGGPKHVGGLYLCSINKLNNLEGCPETIGGNFDFSKNPVISLKHYPKKIEGETYKNNTPVGIFTDEQFELIKNNADLFDSYKVFKIENGLVYYDGKFASRFFNKLEYDNYNLDTLNNAADKMGLEVMW
jgi:hypothetical protein